MSLDAKARDRLQTQGFACQRPGFESVKPWLRVTPALSTAIILLGTVTGSAVVLWLFAVISGFASTRRVHPFDRVSNLLRNREENDPLPINPPPRRFAMAVAALWAAGTGALFASGLLTAGYLSGEHYRWRASLWRRLTSASVRGSTSVCGNFGWAAEVRRGHHQASRDRFRSHLTPARREVSTETDSLKLDSLSPPNTLRGSPGPRAAHETESMVRDLLFRRSL